MPLFDGLTLGEMVLLIAGCILFVALLIAFLWNTMHKQPVKGLLLFFTFPIVMIGYPTIGTIKISEEGFEIDKQTLALQTNPNDEASRKALESNLNDFKGRPFTNPETITKIARAEFALGQDAEAKQNVEKVLKGDPNLKNAQDLRARMEVASRLSTLTAAAEKQPENSAVKQQLQTTVQEASKYKFANPAARQSLQKAAKILGPEQVAAQPHN
jgi:tetratricopeptide (TPR) repeat protein